jgi:biotin carboxyl carrier protein
MVAEVAGAAAAEPGQGNAAWHRTPEVHEGDAADKQWCYTTGSPGKNARRRSQTVSAALLSGAACRWPVPQWSKDAAVGATTGAVKTPMPGKLIKLLVAEGEVRSYWKNGL